MNFVAHLVLDEEFTLNQKYLSLKEYHEIISAIEQSVETFHQFEYWILEVIL